MKIKFMIMILNFNCFVVFMSEISITFLGAQCCREKCWMRLAWMKIWIKLFYGDFDLLLKDRFGGFETYG